MVEAATSTEKAGRGDGGKPDAPGFSVDCLCYARDGRTILDDIGFEAMPGQILGVIGPTRMAYDRVVPIVDITARLLGASKNPQERES